MRIGMILYDHDYPTDIRVEKEAAALLSKDFEVGLLCPRNKPERPLRETLKNGLQVFRADCADFSDGRTPNLRRIAAGLLRWNGYRETEWPKVLGLDGWRFWLNGTSRNWENNIRAFIAEFRPDVLHIHDFPVVPTALEFGLPVVADLHENWPAAIEVFLSDRPLEEQRSPRLRMRSDLWAKFEARYLPKCEAVIVVVPEAAERLYEYGVAREKVLAVSNTEDDTTFKPSDDPAIIDKYAKRWTAVYAGGVGPHRGVDVTLQAVPQIVRQCPDFLLLIVGANDAWQTKLKELSAKLGVTGHVEVLGWQPQSSVNAFIRASQVCLVPHRNLTHTNTTVPHKLFQYMLMNKAVIVSNCPPLKRIVEDTQAGLVFEADNSDSFAQTILRLHANPALAQEFAANGRTAATGKYSWQHDAAKLVELYSRLL